MFIKFLSTQVWVLVIFFLLASCSEKMDDNLYLEKTDSVVSLFKSELQTNLLKAVKERGAENSIEVCAEISPKIERKIGLENNLQIRRISEKFRNPNHKPDEWEQKVLQKWKKDIDSGKSLTVYSEMTNSEFRVMNPIVLENPNCLQCHGNAQDIKPGTLIKIQTKYPNDKARDYKLGDLRGAFSSRWKI